MSEQLFTLSYYVIPLVAVYWFYMRGRAKKQAVSRSVLQEAIETGMTSPPSLHPVVNKDICIGCEACVHACPEFPVHQVLGVIDQKAELVGPTDCIGHGACKTACPVGAISLVFGTSERGVDIPNISPEFETNVPGIYIAGELGGMGLIRNAVEQGRQALEALAKRPNDTEGALDVAIIGAGPAGFAATLAAHEKGMRYVTIEQDSLGGTVANFPRGKLVMTAPVELPLYGKMQFRETQKEALIDFWQGVEEQTGVNIHYREKLESIEPDGSSFKITTSSNSYRVASVLLALGRRGSPRKLDVPGEELDKVLYGVTDPSKYVGRNVCVVGGGDSALEAACAIAEEGANDVILSYRSDAFSRAKRKNRRWVEDLQTQGKLNVMLNTTVASVDHETVCIQRNESATQSSGVERFANDIMVVCVGGILPTGFLKGIGINVETKYGTA